MKLEEHLLSLLACPRCDERPSLDLMGEELVCPTCRAHYPVVNGIPHLLIENATFPESETRQ